MKMERRGFLATLAAGSAAVAILGWGALSRRKRKRAPAPTGEAYAVYPIDSIRPGTYQVHWLDDREPEFVMADIYCPRAHVYVLKGCAIANVADIWVEGGNVDGVGAVELASREPGLPLAAHIETVLPNSWLAKAAPPIDARRRERLMFDILGPDGKVLIMRASV